jgi:hypothetical protein
MATREKRILAKMAELRAKEEEKEIEKEAKKRLHTFVPPPDGYCKLWHFPLVGGGHRNMYRDNRNWLWHTNPLPASEHNNGTGYIGTWNSKTERIDKSHPHHCYRPRPEICK